MEIWEWLRPWWNWWADFTDLFDWDAIGALGTAGALVAAVLLADATNRAQRRRHATILIGLSHAFGTASELMESTVGLIENGLPPKPALESILATGGLQTQLTIANSIGLVDLPTLRVLTSLNAGTAVLSIVIDDMSRSVNEEGVRLATIPATIASAAKKLASHADTLDAEARRLVWPWPIA